MKGEIARKNELAVLWWSACAVALTAAAAAAAGKAAFVDYYASASSLISSLNGITGDIDRLDLKSGVFSDEEAIGVVARLVKAREGFAELITNDDHTHELNEGYILYIDKMTLAIALAREYADGGGALYLGRAGVLLAEGAELRTKLNQTILKDKKNYDIP